MYKALKIHWQLSVLAKLLPNFLTMDNTILKETQAGCRTSYSTTDRILLWNISVCNVLPFLLFYWSQHSMWYSVRGWIQVQTAGSRYSSQVPGYSNEYEQKYLILFFVIWWELSYVQYLNNWCIISGYITRISCITWRNNNKKCKGFDKGVSMLHMWESQVTGENQASQVGSWGEQQLAIWF